MLSFSIDRFPRIMVWSDSEISSRSWSTSAGFSGTRLMCDGIRWSRGVRPARVYPRGIKGCSFVTFCEGETTKNEVSVRLINIRQTGSIVFFD